jgi:hypothetical protein
VTAQQLIRHTFPRLRADLRVFQVHGAGNVNTRVLAVDTVDALKAVDVEVESILDLGAG